MRRRLAVAVCWLALTPLALGACTSLKAGLGTRDSVCFSSLPEAYAVVGPHARFAGVRYLSPINMLSALRHPGRPMLVPPDAFTDVGRHGACLIGYRGAVSAGAEARARRPLPGPYAFAIVVVRQADHRVLGVVLLPNPPTLRFSHLS
jgi:hypothetical protein